MSNAGTHPPEPAMRRVCMYCRAVMDRGATGRMTTRIQVTHGVCPACLAKSDDAELDRMARDYASGRTLFWTALFDGTKK
jgi:hypothetical protein